MKTVLLSVISLALTFASASVVSAQNAAGGLPERMEITLDFTQGWPFNEPVRTPDEQAMKGESYTGESYTYTYTDGEFEKDLKFLFRGNVAPYLYARSKFFMPGSRNSRMTIPAVHGMRLKSVTMAVRNGANFPKGFKIKGTDFSDLAECPGPAYKEVPTVLEFPTADGADTEADTRYYLSFTDSGTQITSMTIVYIK